MNVLPSNYTYYTDCRAKGPTHNSLGQRPRNLGPNENQP